MSGVADGCAALGALPARKETTDVMALAVLPWHPKRHRLFPRSFRPTVVAVLLVQQRLDRLAQQQGAGAAQAVGQPPPLLQQAHVAVNPLAALCPILSTWVNGIIPLLPRLDGGHD